MLFQAEQLLELELSSGFGEKIESAAGGRKEEAAARRKDIKLVFEFQLESDDQAKEENVKNSVEQKEKEDHQQTRDKGEMPVRVKMFQGWNQEDLEAGLTDESTRGSTKGANKFQSSVERKSKKGFQPNKERREHFTHVLNSTEKEAQGKFSTILQKWRQQLQ